MSPRGLRASVAAVACAAAACSAPAPGDETQVTRAALDTGYWTNDAPAASPEPRSWSAMAWDSARNRVVLFGGVGESGPLGDTWEWDGTTWTRVATTGPAKRSQHAMAFDEARGVTVLFGGGDWLFKPLGDTWEWDGVAWAERCTDAACQSSEPEARASHAMAFDASRQTTLVVGGLPEDTWEWNGAAWQLVTSVVPGGAQSGAQAAYDASLGMTLLYDGFSSTVDTLAGSTWTPHPTPSDSDKPMSSLVAAYAAPIDALVLFGGSRSADGGGTTPLAETWEWTTSGWTASTTTGPSPRRYSAMAFDGTRDAVMLFGGDTGDVAASSLGDTWHYRRRAANGHVCEAAVECQSGACTQKICCDPTCKGACDASGKCVVRALCDGDHTLTSQIDATTTDCSPYGCSSDGTCNVSCASVDDCAKGAVCGPDAHCTLAGAPGADQGSGCALARGGGGGHAAAFGMSLALLGLARSRRRSRR